ncbi:MAG: hypothetical protein JEZ00_16005 [Anaerolineaceae bacterium]|nr:hypothetical protein [Anaerolineaceae bacterium]
MKSINQFSNDNSIKKWFQIILLLSALECVICAWLLMSLPGDPENIVFLGFSTPRLLITIIFCISFLGLLVFTWVVQNKQPLWHRINHFISCHTQKMVIFLGVFFILIGWFVFLPAYRVDPLQAYLERLRPLIIWLYLLCGQMLVFLAIRHQIISPIGKYTTRDKKQLLYTGIVFSFLLLLMLTIVLTNWGISPIVRFWEKTGVPILSGQNYWGWVFGIFLVIFLPKCFPESKGFETYFKKYTWLIFLAIWVISAILWVQEPMQFNHFNPGPYPPNYQHYPNSDAQYYDLSAQRALLGQQKGTIDKPAYSALLLGYHLIAGQNSDLMLQIQTVIFAMLPALLFLLGSRMHYPGSGLLVALYANFRVINSIQGQSWIWKTSTPKIMMTEFPTAVLLILLSLFLWGWFTSKKNRMQFALASGGVLALATLMRHNNWIFLPMVIGFSLLVLWKQKKVWVKTVIAFFFMVFISSSPWLIYSQIHYGQPFTFMMAMKGSIKAQRIDPIRAATQEPVQLSTDSPEFNAEVKIPSIAVSVESDTSILQPLNAVGRAKYIVITPLLDTMNRHFFHTLVSTGLSMPITPSFHSLKYLLRESIITSVWDIEWDGKLPFTGLIMLIGNLFVLAMGIAFCWRKWGLAGLTPLAISMTYYLGNGIATTSGGRYLIPVDWVFYFYIALGIMQILMITSEKVLNLTYKSNEDIKREQISKQQTYITFSGLVVSGIFFGIVLLIALGLNGFTRYYPETTKEQIIENLVRNNPSLDQTVLNPIIKAAKEDELNVIYGRLLYPRYVDYQNDIDYELDIAGWAEKKPGLIFVILGNQNDFINGRLQMNSYPDKLPENADAIVFTCPDQDAYALIIFENDTARLLTRSDMTNIDCSQLGENE